jgi:hypothetical protein
MTLPPDSQDLLIRVDERTKSIAEDMADMKLGLANYVTRSEFAPVRAIVFGAVALILVAFMGTIAYLANWQH